MSRSLSSINQNLLMTRIFLFYLQFLTFFSIMAIDLLAIIVLQLNDFAKKASELKVPRPNHIKQNKEAQENFKKNSHLKSMLYP